MTAFTGCILLLALLLIDVNDSASRKMENGTANLKIRAGKILKLYNRQIHQCKIALLKRRTEYNHAANKSVMFNSEGEELVIAKKSRRDIYDNQKSGVTYQERIDFLVAHNHWRRLVDPQASNMIQMVWSLDLERYALLWASNCRYDEGLPDFIHISDKYKLPGVGIGQNIWSRIGSYNIEDAIRDFYNEKTGADCNQDNKCRRYKQLVWAESIYMGCGILYCPLYLASSSLDKDVFNIVCNYSPAGNRLSAEGIPIPPFKVGPSGTQCPPTHPQVDNGLCRPDQPCKDVTECRALLNTATCLCSSTFYKLDTRGKSREELDEISATFEKSKAEGMPCCSVRLIVSPISLSCTVFVAFVVTYALSLSLERAS